MLDQQTVEQLAQRLDEAERSKSLIPAFTREYPDLTTEDAYAIQRAWTKLQLARGMDDRKWELFGPELTVYGGCKINVSAVTSPVQIMALLFQSAKDINDPVLLDPRKLLRVAVHDHDRGFGCFGRLAGHPDLIVLRTRRVIEWSL